MPDTVNINSFVWFYIFLDIGRSPKLFYSKFFQCYSKFF